MRTKTITERGQVLILFAFAAIGLFAIVGLAIDGSKKFSDQRHAQNAADTAALAAALAKTNTLTAAGQKSDPTICPPAPGDPYSAACTALLNAGFYRANSNGYSGNLINNVVEIYSPPISGYYSTVQNKDQYVQVIITSYVPTTFMRVVGINQARNLVQAVAYASPGFNLAEGAMIISYDPNPNCSTGGTGGYSVEVTGSSTVNLKGGGMFLNSNAVCGFRIPNCADLNITAVGSSAVPGINTVGANNINTEGCTFDPPVNKNFSQPAVAIPDEVYWPKVPPECSMSGSPTPYKFPTQIMGSDGKLHDQWLIKPGFYTDFPQPALVSNKSYIYMQEGVYCIDPPLNQDLSWSPVDAAFLNGSTNPSKNPYASAYNTKGVTLYIKDGGGFTINASSPTFLDATNDPNSDYQGYLFILEGNHTSHPSCTINGGSDININGMIFAPYCDFTINGHAGETSEFNAQLIGWDIKINGTNEINFTYDPANKVKIKRKVGLMR